MREVGVNALGLTKISGVQIVIRNNCLATGVNASIKSSIDF